MKAKIDLSHIKKIIPLSTKYWEIKRDGRKLYPDEFYNIWKRNETINIIPSFVKMFGDYKFLNPVDNKIYWIRKELIKPIYEIENNLFEI
jgi:hypothetical protein